MPLRPDAIRYKSNGVILGKRPLGPKTWDQVTGFWSYRSYMTYNAFGEYVDARGEGMDPAPDNPSINQLGPQTPYGE